MTVASFFEKIVGLQQQKSRATAASYREMIVRIASGKEPDPTDVERLLANVGKSTDDLRCDVPLRR